jgi:GGDEF domain-containing protein
MINRRNVIIALIGFILITLLVIFNNKIKSYFDNKNKIDNELQNLKSYELELNYHILKIAQFFYSNLDNIKNDETEINSILNYLEKESTIRNDKQLYEEFKEYKKAVLNKIEDSYRSETYIIPVKNANIYIIKLLDEYNYHLINNKEYSLHFSKALSNMLFFKNTFDKSFLINLKKEINILNNFQLNKENGEFNSVFVKNINIMNSYFPKYNNYLNKILNSKSLNKLEKLHNDFLKVANKKLIIVTIVSYLLIGFVLFVGILIFYLFYRVDKKNELLEKLSITDDLTGLYNRRKFQDDSKNIKNPILLIVNIDRFKYYNELYGIEVGDFILKEIAKRFKILLSKKDVYIYRLGADDFGILSSKNKINADKLSKTIIDYFKNDIIEFNDL